MIANTQINAQTPQYSFPEEIANVITHSLGTILAIAALVLMLVFSSLRGTASHIVSSALFGTSLIILYAASTLYHASPWPKVKLFFRNLDHAAIFILIAGSYTPFTLITLRGAWGWSIFAVVWTLAFLGIILELTIKNKPKGVSLAFYITLGWIVVIAIVPLIQSIQLPGLILLAAGGLAYTTGCIFYAWKSLFFNHAIWHLFVLAGSVCHFFAVIFYVIP